MTEFREKQKRIRALLERHKLDALLLSRVSSFAWATCGAASYVNIADSNGTSQLLITNNIEAPRLIQEEKLTKQRWKIIASAWHCADIPLGPLTNGLIIGSDSPWPGSVDLSGDL